MGTNRRNRGALAVALGVLLFGTVAPAVVAGAPAGGDGAAASRPSAWPQVAGLRRWWYGGELPPSRDVLATLTPWVEAHPDDVEAVFFLGLLHHRNVPGVDPDRKTGEQLIERAAKAGFGPAQSRLAMGKLVGPPEARDAERAVRLLAGQAERGDSDALFYLAYAFTDGSGGLPASPAKARGYAERALALGNVRAHVLLAESFTAEGEPARAIAELEAGARAGDPESLGALGERKFKGIGTARDLPGAFACIRGAAERGQSSAQVVLATLYRDGLGAPKDAAEAARWFRLAARAGESDAKRALARLYLWGNLPEPDPKAGVALLRELVEAADPEAQADLGRLHLEGLWVPEDRAEARRLFEAAASKGSVNATLYLKWMDRAPGVR